MADAAERRRHTDRGWRRLLRENWYRDIWLLLITGLLVLALWAQSKETDTRRSQSCVVFERLHRTDVQNLKLTYDYVDKLPDAALHDPLNQAVLGGVERTEKQAVASAPPRYCLAPGVGLPGTVTVPERPARVDLLLRRLSR